VFTIVIIAIKTRVLLAALFLHYGIFGICLGGWDIYPHVILLQALGTKKTTNRSVREKQLNVPATMYYRVKFNVTSRAIICRSPGPVLLLCQFLYSLMLHN